MSTARILVGDALEQLRTLPDESVQCCVTSPPYWGLRDYGVDGQLGLEETPEEYVDNLVAVFREVRRVLRDDGTLWLNLGDSYAANGISGLNTKGETSTLGGSANVAHATHRKTVPSGLKPKDLCGIPWRVAFALQADGWWLRSDIIWCLSGGTKVYARTQKGEMPMTIKDMVRLDPSTVQLWNGEKWTQVRGWNESERGEPLEIELRSGERIGCTEGHLWPTQRGNVRADELEVGDVIESTTLPEPDAPHRPLHIDEDVAWMLGLYLVEGSQSRGRLQFAGDPDEAAWRMERLGEIAERFGGTVRAHDGGANVVVDCAPLTAIVDQYIHGRTAKTKGVKVRAWRHDNAWLTALLNGYLHGDGHHDAGNGRWRLGLTRNDRLASDLRTICARLGYTLTLNATTTEGFGWPCYRGEIRRTRSGHHNERPRSEVVAIRRSRARKFWDIGVADEPHLFSLASGVLTHNSKPNPMPESVTDRPTKAHEYVFHLSKSERYYYDHVAIAEESVTRDGRKPYAPGRIDDRGDGHDRGGGKIRGPVARGEATATTRNRRSVWTINTRPYPEAHFAVFPPELVEPCIQAGTSQEGACPECGAPWERVVDRPGRKGPSFDPLAITESGALPDGPGTHRNMGARYQAWLNENPKETTGWRTTCDCDTEETVSCIVLDPFAGSGTVGMVATGHGRDAILIDLNPEYAEMMEKRIGPMFVEVPARKALREEPR